MAKLMCSMISFCFYCTILTICLTFIQRIVHSKTLGSDAEALHSLLSSLDPNSISSSSFLNSWNFQADPCESSGDQFLGILCTIPEDNSSSRVTAINLDRAGYDGFLSPEIGNLTELIILNLNKNMFRGPIPDTISNLQKLTTLTLSENFFTGTIPTGVGNLRRLEIVDLSQNKLSGSIPASISGLRSLTHLILSNNGFSGTIPDLTGLWQLTSLDISSNQLYGGMPKLPKSLQTVSLSHNILSGRISSIGNLEQLLSLDLSDNRFSGSIEKEILTLPEVISVNVSLNRFTLLEVGKFTGSQTQLQVIDAQRNSLQGHLPVDLVTAENLTSINLGNNQFSGRIPREYGEKLGESWRILFLDHNFLVGSLPPQFSSTGAMTVSGSLANNCLKCPSNVPLCHGGQRPASECVGQDSRR
ncbi:probable leucine-rich repeat receptor-like protein kinase At1g35710 [Malania oleifera]|uniref:probable leucine-rich repeat receptor-like protein kinase At1g35710 n=1 Tax=Malania oleifera TaxID=397392 RepID=UPI0025AEC925|nr:probable leucine-rich repeat receptor-like protein kinase At1g35710 [Malania oleifera]